jgi:predicted deacetylase
MTTGAFTVEIHDVSPRTLPEAMEIRDAVRRIGIERPSLLVIPDHQDEEGQGCDLRAYARSVDWLVGEQAAGAEIVQHGTTHRAPGPPPSGLANAFMHHVFSRGLAEFAHLTHAEARRRLLAGRRILKDCGLRARGFIAPAWQQSRAAIRAVSELGFGFTAFFGHVLRFAGRRERLSAPVLTFDAPSAVVDIGKRLFMRAVEWLARSAPVVRVALHPADLHGARPLPHILTRIRSLMRTRRPVTYQEWMG